MLGAGFSRRFGGADKRLHALGGVSVAEVTLGKYADVFDQMRLVVRDDDDELARRAARFAVDTIRATDAHLGMGHSLAAGFQNLDWDWAFVALLDMPYVEVGTLRTLQRAAQRAAATTLVLRPLHDGRAGHPIGIARPLFGEVAQSRGDEGARRLIERHQANIENVPVADPGILEDIDTPADIRDNDG